MSRAARAQPAASCPDCLSWGASYGSRSYCRACYDFTRRYHLGACASCQRILAIKKGHCRLCWLQAGITASPRRRITAADFVAGSCQQLSFAGMSRLGHTGPRPRGPVSAGQASPAASGSRVVRDPVRALQHALYRAAKADPGRRFHAPYDKVCRRDVLWRARVAVRANRGAPGIDKVTLAQAEEYGVTRLLGELASELREGRYRPLPARRVFIPKLGTTEQRPLSIPAVRDRIVQAACKIVLEPVFEADFLPISFGFRPRRSAHDALQVLIDECSGRSPFRLPHRRHTARRAGAKPR